MEHAGDRKTGLNREAHPDVTDREPPISAEDRAAGEELWERTLAALALTPEALAKIAESSYNRSEK